MDHQQLGGTPINLPEIGLGTWEYRGGVAPLRAGIENGASLIDTAEAYGTEDIVGEATVAIRHEVFIASKVWPTHFRYPDVLKAADSSLLRLRTDYIDLYQLHWPNAAVPITDTMAAMQQLVDVGKVRFIGVCNFSVRQLRTAQACLTNARIVSNQVPYNLVDRHIERNLLDYCRRERVTVIAYSPLHRGLDHLRQRDPTAVLARVAEETGKTEAQVALNWCISRPGIIAIPKADSVQHTLENCAASGWRLSLEHVLLLEKAIRPARGAAAELRRALRKVFPRRYRPESL